MVTCCFCGRPLHYTDPFIEAAMCEYTTRLGEFINITTGERTWRVQRHFAALHGIKAQELPYLGFEEVTHA